MIDVKVHIYLTWMNSGNYDYNILPKMTASMAESFEGTDDPQLATSKPHSKKYQITSGIPGFRGFFIKASQPIPPPPQIRV